MEVVSFVLCEHVNYSKESQFNILGGGITSLAFKKIPTEFAICILLQIMLEPWETEAQHSLKIRIMGEDKMVVEQELLPFSVPKGTVYYTTDATVRIYCDHPGWYRFDAVINERVKRELRVHISELRQISSPSGS